jgi:hypothetical protein
MAPNPQTAGGIGGADYSQYALPQNIEGGLPSGPPEGANVDSTYLANEAALRGDISSRYADILQQLGYVDPVTGQFIPGSLIQNANLAEGNAEQQRQQAILQNTQNAQQQGILFSGKRGEMQAQAEAPWLQQIAQTETQLPQDLATQYQNAAGLIGEYNTRNDQELAAAAARYTAAQQQQATAPAAPASTAPSTNVTSTPPPTSTPTNTFEGIPTGPSGTYTYQTLPYRSGTQPFIAMAGGGEVDRPTNALIGEDGPESVVPRTGLNADENQQLTNLQAAAQARMGGGMRRNDEPGIHWFGPGGAGVDYPPENPPFGPPPTVPPLTPAHALYMAGHHAQALDQYLAHHAAAVAGRAIMPGWAQHAMANRASNLRTHPVPPGLLHPFLDPSPPIGVLPPGRPVY